MNYSSEKEKIIKIYNEKLKKNSANDLLSTGNQLRRNIRFKVLSEIGNFENKKVLDLGCGTGDFYQYLLDNSIECDYTGYDINEKIVNIAKERFPKVKFEVKDILENSFPQYDYIVSTSSFNNKLESISNYTFIESILSKCYEHANEGVAIDFLNSYADYHHDYAHYYEPEKIFSISKTITRRVTLRNDYPLFEFAVYLYNDIEFPYGKKYE